MEPREHGRSEADPVPGRWRRRLWLAALVAAVVLAPRAIVLTPLRDRPLAWLTTGLEGALSSRAAAWTWWGGIEYRDVLLTGRDGRVIAAARRVSLDRGLIALAVHRHEFGTLRITAPEVIAGVRRGGSDVEDLVAPWLARWSGAAAGRCDVEVVDGTVHAVDLDGGAGWRITDLLAACALGPGAEAAGWTVSGRIVPSGQPPRDLAATFGPSSAAEPAPAVTRLERTTVAAGATATLAEPGGVSVSAPARGAAGELAVNGNHVPLGCTALLARRFDQPWHASGHADIRLAIVTPPAGGAVVVRGTVSAAPLAIVGADGAGDMLRLDRCEMPLDVTIGDGQVVIREWKATAPLLAAEASGRVGLPTGGAWEWVDTLIRDDFALAVDVDLAAAARALPGGLEIRPDVRVAGGQLQLAASAHAAGDDRLLEVRVTARDLAAVQGDRPLRWSEPFSGWLRARLEAGRAGRLLVEEARLASPAMELVARGGRDELAVEWTADLAGLITEAGEILDLGGIAAAGSTRGRVDIGRRGGTDAAGRPVAVSLFRAAVGVEGLRLAVPGRPEWRDDEITLTAEGNGMPLTGGMVVDAATASVAAGGDRLEARLSGGALVDLRRLVGRLGGGGPAGRWLTPTPTATDGVQIEVGLEGAVAAWQRRLAALGVLGARLPAVEAGDVRATATLTVNADAWRVPRASAEIERVAVAVAGRRIVEPRVVAAAAGAWLPDGTIDVSAAEILTATASLRSGGMTLRPATPAGDDWLGRLRGRCQWQADVGRLGAWVADPDAPAAWECSGRAWGTLEGVDTPAGQNCLVEVAAHQLALAERVAGGAARTVWAEPQATLTVEVTRPATGGDGTLVIDRVALASSTVGMAAAGTLAEPHGRRIVDVGGTLAVDWDRLSALALPWTGGRLRLTGGGPRPFQVRVPLRPPPASATAAVVPLPSAWLAAQGERGRDAALTLPAEVAAGPAAGGRLRTIVLDASAGWNAADLDGLPLDAGEMPLRLFEGQLAFGPFDVPAAGGRLRGAPWLRIDPGPAEWIVPPGRIVDRVALSSDICQRWISWVSPLIGRATRATGVVTIDGAGARLPAATPWAGEAACQVIFENLEVTPGPHAKPLADLFVRLQSVLDPRFAFGDKAVLLRVRPEPVHLRLAGGRLWQEGLTMDMGQLVVRSAGSVGVDGSLAMEVEIAFRGDLVGAAPVVSRLLRTPLVVPLKGTVDHPRFDAGAIDTIVARIVDNTAEAVLRDGVGRGLEQLEILFGNPPPPRAP